MIRIFALLLLSSFGALAASAPAPRAFATLRDALASIPDSYATDGRALLSVSGYRAAADWGPDRLGVATRGSALATNLGEVFNFDNGWGQLIFPGGGEVNLKHWGAFGNGTSNDTASITAASAKVQTLGGGTLLVPPGTYLVSKVGPVAHFANISNVSISAESAVFTEADYVDSTWTPVTLTNLGTVATAVWAAPHGFIPGSLFLVKDSTDVAFDGYWTVTHVDSPTQIRFNLTAYNVPAGAATALAHVSDTSHVLFRFDSCTNVNLGKIVFRGHVLPVDNQFRLGWRVVEAFRGTKGVRGELDVNGAAYGFYSGEYNNQSISGCSDLRIKVVAKNVGYPVQATGTDDSAFEVVCDTVHRGGYFGGVRRSSANIWAKNWDIVGALLAHQPDPVDSRGCEDFTLRVWDTGTTVPQKLLAYGGYRHMASVAGYANTNAVKHRNLDIRVYGKNVPRGAGLIVQTYGTNHWIDGLKFGGNIDQSGLNSTNTGWPFFIYDTSTTTAGHYKDLVIEDFTWKSTTNSGAYPGYIRLAQAENDVEFNRYSTDIYTSQGLPDGIHTVTVPRFPDWTSDSYESAQIQGIGGGISFIDTTTSIPMASGVSSNDFTVQWVGDVPSDNSGLFVLTSGASATTGSFGASVTNGHLIVRAYGASSGDWIGLTATNWASSRRGKVASLGIVKTASGLSIYTDGHTTYGADTYSGTPPAWSDAIIGTNVLVGIDNPGSGYLGKVYRLAVWNFSRALDFPELAVRWEAGAMPAGGSGYTISDSIGNGSFETLGGGGADVFASWTEQTYAGSTITASTNAISGSVSMALSVDGLASFVGVTSSEVLVPGAVYEVSFWGRVVDGTSGQIALVGPAGGDYPIVLSGSWARYSYSLAWNAVSFSIKRWSLTGLTAEIDDVRVRRVGVLCDYDWTKSPGDMVSGTYSSPLGGVSTKVLARGLGISADRGDNSANLEAGQDAPIQVWASDISGARSVNLQTNHARRGDVFRIIRTGVGPGTLTAAGVAITPGTWVDFAYDGSNWVVAASGTGVSTSGGALSRTPDWVNVVDYGADDDPGTDDTLALQAAAAALLPGQTLYAPPGLVFRTTNTVQIDDSRARVDFSGSTIQSFDLLRRPVLRVGPRETVVTNMSFALDPATNRVTEVPAATFSAGDMVMLYNDVQSPANYNPGQFAFVESASGTEIILDRFPDAALQVTNAYRFATPPESVEIRNVVIDLAGASDGTGISVIGRGHIVANCRVTGTGEPDDPNYIGIELRGQSITARDNFVSGIVDAGNASDRAGYGVFATGDNITIENNELNDCKHCVSTSERKSVSRELRIIRNRVRQRFDWADLDDVNGNPVFAGAVDVHANVRHVEIRGNDIRIGGRYALSLRNGNFDVVQNDVEVVEQAGLSYSQHGTGIAEAFITRGVFIGNRFRTPTNTIHVYFDRADVGVSGTHSNLLFQGNTFEGAVLTLEDQSATVTNPIVGISISGNVFTRTNGTPLLFTGPVSNVMVVGNSFNYGGNGISIALPGDDTTTSAREIYVAGNAFRRMAGAGYDVWILSGPTNVIELGQNRFDSDPPTRGFDGRVAVSRTPASSVRYQLIDADEDELFFNSPTGTNPARLKWGGTGAVMGNNSEFVAYREGMTNRAFSSFYVDTNGWPFVNQYHFVIKADGLMSWADGSNAAQIVLGPRRNADTTNGVLRLNGGLGLTERTEPITPSATTATLWLEEADTSKSLMMKWPDGTSTALYPPPPPTNTLIAPLILKVGTTADPAIYILASNPVATLAYHGKYGSDGIEVGVGTNARSAKLLATDILTGGWTLSSNLTLLGELTRSDGSTLTGSLDSKAATNHTHDASNTVSGQFESARLGSGTSDTDTFLRGGDTPTWDQLSADDIPNLPASRITSGTFDPARLGTGTATTNTFLQGNGTNAPFWGTIPSVPSPTNGIADAPADGIFYGRKNNAWTQPDISDLSGVSSFGLAWVDGTVADTTDALDFLDLIGSGVATIDSPAKYAVRVGSGGTVSTRHRLNLIAATGLTLAISDDAINDEADVTVGIADRDWGDITSTSSGSVWDIDAGAVGEAEIADGAVAYDKIQNVTASRLLGRAPGSDGPPVEVEVGEGLGWDGAKIVNTASGDTIPFAIAAFTHVSDTDSDGEAQTLDATNSAGVSAVWMSAAGIFRITLTSTQPTSPYKRVAVGTISPSEEVFSASVMDQPPDYDSTGTTIYVFVQGGVFEGQQIMLRLYSY